MSSGVTAWGASSYLEMLFGARQAPPTSYWVALCTEGPAEQTDGSALAEPPSEAGYARVEIASDATSWTEAVNGVVTNLATVFYETATADWPPVTHYALCDAQVDGDVYIFGAFSTPRLVGEGNAARIAPGALSVSAGSLSGALVSAF